MLSGRAVTLHQRSDSGEHLVEDVVSETDGEEAEATVRVLYRASFQELMSNYLQYDSIIWAVISLVLVLAWGVGLLMLLYLPYKRYALKDILSRKLCVTENKIVYKASRPSYLPFMGIVKKERKVPLHLVVDVIIEQACKRRKHSSWETCSSGRTAISWCLQSRSSKEASKRIQEVQSWKPRMYSGKGPSDVTPISIHSPSAKVKASSRHALLDSRAEFLTVSCSLSLKKLVNQ